MLDFKNMSFLRGSLNYVWCTTSVLGKGATGAVFQGVNKHNGEPVAVKTFNQLSQMRPHDVQIREFEVLKKVKHENIVKLLAIEEEQDGRGKVIVMELCTGGSLFNILDDPENTYGLEEEEFLLVLQHLSAGMKHLRDQNLVHRDLKPGNIMKFISDDGSTVYKLTDFGAARELEEDQQFMSLYGTEEYLHPDMYERAVLRKPVGKTFGATVDLWSIGVTLYHVATGNLPFRPFGGRRNKETMYYITTKKASGVISGTQSSENGPIEWCRSLPKGCQLSHGLKKYVTPLLAGLLEVDTTKIWSFEKFFNEVTNILSRKRLHIFHIHKMQCIKIYFDPLEKLNQFKDHLCEQTDVLPTNQILLLDNKQLTEIISEETPGKDYPNTRQEVPIILFSNENNNVIINVENDLPKLPSFHNSVNVENDASVAKTICSIAHACKRKIERLALCSKLTHDSVAMFTYIVKQELLQVFLKSSRLLELAKYVEKATDMVMRSQRSIQNLVGLKCSTAIDWKAELEAGINQELVSGLNIAIKQLHSRFFSGDTLTREWEKAGTRCTWKGRAPQRANTSVQRLRDSWQHMIRDRATRSLTYNDEQFHVLERMKMDVMGNNLIKNLLEQEVISSIVNTADSLADWYKMAQTIFLQGKILDKDVDNSKKSLEKFFLRMEESDKLFFEECTNVGLTKPVSQKPGKKVMKGLDVRTFRSKLCEIHSAQEENHSLLKENCFLLESFQISLKEKLETKE